MTPIDSWLIVAALVIGAVFVGAYLAASARIDREWEAMREIDRAVPVWSRPVLYDWEQEGDFG